MKILIVGNGGRENAMARSIYLSKSFQDRKGRIFFTAENPGMEKFGEPVKINPTDITVLKEFALENKIDLTVTGPEIPLSLGITDEFQNSGLLIFGPSKSAAEIESSKVFAKGLMKENNIPTAKYKVFDKEKISEAVDYLDMCSYPLVFKADGLAAGKGVVILKDKSEAETLLKSYSEGRALNNTGNEFVFEEFLDGEEVSVFAVCDGKTFVLLPFSQDHKKILDGETGANTGGMGAVAPVKKFMTVELIQNIRNKIIEPVLNALEISGRKYRGYLYCGLIIVNGEPHVIEFNSRFGDPETQAVLPLIKSDFLELLMASALENLSNYKFEASDKYSCAVVAASGGYPGNYETGKVIEINMDENENCILFHSGTKHDSSGKIVTNGGRVLTVTGVSEASIEEAQKIAYENLKKIRFEKMYYRNDIGFRQIKE